MATGSQPGAGSVRPLFPTTPLGGADDVGARAALRAPRLPLDACAPPAQTEADRAGVLFWWAHIRSYSTAWEPIGNAAFFAGVSSMVTDVFKL
jgi:hypothetical protein